MEWVTGFVRRHVDRFGGDDWPATVDGWETLVECWAAAFDRHGIDEEAADAASIRLAESPSQPWRRGEHLPRLLATAADLSGANRLYRYFDEMDLGGGN